MENIKEQLEQVIKKILSENKGLPLDKLDGDLLERALGTMNFQLKQSLGREEITSASDTNVLTEKDVEVINEIMLIEKASLIAYEVLKVVVEKIEKHKQDIVFLSKQIAFQDKKLQTIYKSQINCVEDILELLNNHN